MRKVSNYTEAEKAQILEEVKATGSVAAVAKKNGIPIGTVYTWTNPKKKRDKPVVKDDTATLKGKLADFELENKILKELLKKTYQVWRID